MSQNTLSTLDTLTSRFESVAACWAHAEKAGRTISLTQFEALSTSAILFIPRRLDIADAIDPTTRLIFERLIRLWLARPDTRYLPPDCRQETYVILDETTKAGSLARLNDIVLIEGQGRFRHPGRPGHCSKSSRMRTMPASPSQTRPARPGAKAKQSRRNSDSRPKYSPLTKQASKSHVKTLANDHQTFSSLTLQLKKEP